MQAVCVRRFLDRESGVMREEGERFECSPERFAEINATRYGSLAVEASETPSEVREEPGLTERRGGRKRAARAD